MIQSVQVSRLNENAIIPTRASEHAAGFDLYALEGGMLATGIRCLFKTGIAVAIPDGHVGYIKPRSGLAIKNGISVLGGVIDSDYRGDIGVILLNNGFNTFEVARGDRIAQLVIQPLTTVRFIEVPFLGDTARGAGGFGSTGVSL